MNQSTKSIAIAAFLAVSLNLYADEVIPVLKVGSEVYSNVTVIKVNATDVFFNHSKGFGNAKLKNLDAELQKKFNYDPAKGKAVESRQTAANFKFQQNVAVESKAPKSGAPGAATSTLTMDGGGDPVAPDISARSFRGQTAPQLVVENWVTSAPDMRGKFVLVDFWATWCGPCRQSIPHLNQLQQKYKDNLIVVGISKESVAEIRRMTSPPMNYSVGSDTQGRTSAAVGVEGIPHTMLIDPKGIVRYEGHPGYLGDNALGRLIAKYSK